MEDAGGLFAYAPAYMSRRKISGPENAFCWLSFSGEADETGSQPSWRSPSCFTDEALGPTRQEHDNSLHCGPRALYQIERTAYYGWRFPSSRTETPKQAGGRVGRQRRPAHGILDQMSWHP